MAKDKVFVDFLLLLSVTFRLGNALKFCFIQINVTETISKIESTREAALGFYSAVFGVSGSVFVGGGYRPKRWYAASSVLSCF